MKKMFFNLNLKSVIAFLVIILFSFSANALSQTPQYYNLNTGTSSNSFPFNVAGGKAVNSLFLAGEFNQPSPIPPGQQITKVYFRTSTTGTRTYTNLHILMAQSTITTLTTGQFYPGPWDTVYFNASATLSSVASGWMQVTLDDPFPYDPTKSLVLFVGQCGATGTAGSVYNSTLSDIRRTWSVGGCPFVPYASGDASMLNFGVDVVPAVQPPNLLFFKFEDNPSPTMVLNCALNPVGSNPAPLAATTPLTPGGQFDTCITGTGVANGGVTPGWNWNLGASSWTISMWLTIPSTSSGSAFYLFGDAGTASFRCFHNGVALPDNLVLRGGGLADLTVTGIGPAPTVVTFVYDSVAHQVKAYKNGVLAVTQSVTLNMTTGTGFRVGGYGSSLTFVGKMDEFRVYKRALDSTEVLAVYNQDIGCALPVGISSNNNQIPNIYKLGQNYPNPFNPITSISFAIPKAGIVKLVIYDVLGREVASVLNELITAGIHSVEFDASSLASGVYFYRIDAGEFTDVKKMMLIK